MAEPLPGARILLAESGELSATITTAALRQAGYEVDTVADGQAALEFT